VFYVEKESHIDVWRVLHEMKNIPAWLINASLIVIYGKAL
jgi:hypothetical protein